MFCPGCGRDVGDNSVCPYCNTSFNVENNQPQQSHGPEHEIYSKDYYNKQHSYPVHKQQPEQEQNPEQENESEEYNNRQQDSQQKDSQQQDSDIPKSEENPVKKESQKGNKKKANPIIIMVVAILAVTAAIGIIYAVSRSKSDPVSAESTEVESNSAETTGEIITFGSYEQDNNTGNGKEAIEWRVLEVKDGKALIISEKALDCVWYNESYAEVTWETCTLRTWLNGTFYNTAFSSEEKNRIQSTKVTADANPSYSTDPGNDTTDKVFLLSITEVEKYFSSDDDRMCVPTEYAIDNGAWTSSNYEKDGEATCWWWLRSPGSYSTCAVFVDSDGGVISNGSYVSHGLGCVRPALWIEI